MVEVSKLSGLELVHGIEFTLLYNICFTQVDSSPFQIRRAKVTACGRLHYSPCVRFDQPTVLDSAAPRCAHSE